jgi:hypothetical protein
MRRVAVASVRSLGVGRAFRSTGLALLRAFLSAGPAVASRWTVQSTPNPARASGSILWSVSCPSRRVCFAVGDYARSTTGYASPLAERWNGREWSIQRTALPGGAKGGDLMSVSCPSSRACTAVGLYYNQDQTELTLAEHWNGVRWSIQPTPFDQAASYPQLDGVSCSSRRACTAVGSSLTGDPGYSQMLAERWNGRKWSIQQPREPNLGINPSLSSVSCPSSRVCTAVGAYASLRGTGLTLAERWNGVNWSIQRTPLLIRATAVS